MLHRILVVCVFVALCSSLSCRWMDHKFRQFSEKSFKLLDMMANQTEDTEVKFTPFPYGLYKQAFNASVSAEDKVAFTVQILKEVSALVEEEDSSSSWDEITVENFLNVINQQADELQLCVGGHRKTNRKLQVYFKNLSSSIFGQMGYSASAWEIIRMEIKSHLIKVYLLVSSVLRN